MEKAKLEVARTAMAAAMATMIEARIGNCRIALL
eukprot:CAMPEP_0178435930 /NCGR_PEP_ID=MMETSP0689_2-20121128/34180_1 /TAXON_ID=160604 /ORGANISM="Amphidinium massartii, Strain CS-259" /LENGTH=33 /DNA_ID= /DNA_START= /DNA_END= /DNA_ORIENTATION=